MISVRNCCRAHRSLRFGDAPCQLGPSPQGQLLFHAVSKIAVFRRVETARAIDAAAEQRRWIFPSADRLRVERRGAHAGVSGLERRIVRARFRDETIDVVSCDDNDVGRRDGFRIFRGPAVQQAGARDQNCFKKFHGMVENG